MTETIIPAPLVPADCDLRDFAFMPVDIQRLLTSDTWLLGTGEARAASIALWFSSWHQVPAGSLPNSDIALRQLSQSSKWKPIRDHVLRGWLLCSDGRVYHPVVCEKALEAWLEKLAQRISGGEGNAKRWKTTFDRTPLDTAMNTARGMLIALNPQSKALNKKHLLRVGSGSLPESGGESGGESGRDRVGIGSGVPSGSQETVTENLKSKALSGKPDGAQDAKRKARADAVAILEFLNEKAGRQYQPVASNIDLITARLRDGATADQCREVILNRLTKWGSNPDMEEYLRPATLFGARNFAQYVGGLGAAKAKAAGAVDVAFS